MPNPEMNRSFLRPTYFETLQEWSWKGNVRVASCRALTKRKPKTWRISGRPTAAWRHTHWCLRRNSHRCAKTDWPHRRWWRSRQRIVERWRSRSKYRMACRHVIVCRLSTTESFRLEDLTTFFVSGRNSSFRFGRSACERDTTITIMRTQYAVNSTDLPDRYGRSIWVTFQRRFHGQWWTFATSAGTQVWQTLKYKLIEINMRISRR